MKRALFFSTLILLAIHLPISRQGHTNGSVPGPDEALQAASQESDSLPPDSLASDTLALDSQLRDSLMADSLESAMSTGDSFVQESASVDSLSQGPAIISLEEFREVENRAFGVGEKLAFEISYGPIKAGTAVMEIRGITQLNGRDCYHVISTAKSNKVFSSFYKVEDRVESFFDQKGLFTWKFVQRLREGKYRADRFAEYDQVHHTVTTNKGTMDVPAYVQDVLSTMYYVRTQNLTVGEQLYVDNHSGRKVYPLAVKVHRRERVEVPAGSFDCFVVEPMLKAGGLFKHEGRIWVWLTADEKKMPVLMKTKVIIGTVDAKLKSYRLGKIS
jgi:hypothetical protein